MNTQQGSMKQTKEQVADELYTDSEDNYLLYNEPRINDIRHWQREAFEAGANWMKEQGTIHWFSIANGELPPVGEEVFVFAEIGEFKCLAKGYIEASKNWRHNGGDWQPTHFAYINYPE